MVKKTFHDVNQEEKPPVLIAGGAGFVGSFLCELLLQQNCRVICLDNLTTGSKKNLENCLKDPDFLFIQQDVSQPLSQELGEPDYIFHLAGLEAYVSGTDLSLETLLANISGTINLLKLAKKTGAKFLLGSSPRVFQARIASGKLADYFGKGIAAELASFSEAKRSAEALTTEYVEKEEVDARIVRLDWIYGPRMSFKTGGILVQMIKQALEGGPMKVPGNGSQKIHPTFVSDAVYGLIKAMFSSGTSGKIYNLVNPEEETLLSIAYQLQNIIGKDLEIEHIAEEEIPVSETKIDLVSQKKLGWEPKVGLKRGLQQTLDYFKEKIKKPVKPKAVVSKERVVEKKETKKRKGPSFFSQTAQIVGWFLLALIIIFSLPSALLLNSFLGMRNLRSAYHATIAGDFIKTVSLAKAAKEDFRQAQGNLQSLTPVFTLLGQGQLQNQIETLLGIGLKAGKGVGELGGVAQKVVKINRAIFQDETADINQLAQEMKAELDSVYEQFSYLEGEIKAKPIARRLLERFDQEFVRNLSTAREMFLKAKEGIQLLPDLVGLYGKRTYLVLFQNNMELRPTGGFIGSFALVTFENGKLIDFQVMNVYSADGQLKGHVEPPAAIRRYLGEAGWYLRDSNFNPDFPTSAIRATWFLEKEIGRRVDGVVGVDLFLAQKILRAIGPVNLVDYQEVISADNLFERAEYHAEVGFFPGSTQKEDFLGALANTLLVEVQQAEEEKWLALGQAIFQSLKSKDLIVFLNNQEAARILSDLGWDGGIRNVKCLPAEALAKAGQISNYKCLVDYLMIVEANFGINKANYFVKRNLTHQVSFGLEGEVRETLRIDYHNQSQTEIFPAGKYKNYLRILTPAGTVLEKVVIDEEELEREKIDEEEIVGKTVFGFLVEVPIQTKKTVEISYRLANRLAAEEGSHYLLYLQKQPGIEDTAFNFWLVPPGGMKVASTRPESRMADGLTVFTPKLDQDLVFEVFF